MSDNESLPLFVQSEDPFLGNSSYEQGRQVQANQNLQDLQGIGEAEKSQDIAHQAKEINTQAENVRQSGQGESFSQSPEKNAQKPKKSTSTYLSKEQKAEKELLERVPPHNAFAEKAVIGGVFLDPSFMHTLLDILTPEDFYLPAHKVLYKAFVALYKLSKPIDANTVLIYLEDRQLLEQVGGAVYINMISENLTSEEIAKYYAGIVKDRAVQRMLITTCADIIGKSYNAAVEIDELLNESEKDIFTISEKRTTKSYESIGSITERVFRSAQNRMEIGEAITGIPTGYQRIDEMTAGLQPSDLIILAARPAMGKTAFALNLAINIGVKNRLPVAVFSLEMSSSSLCERMLSLHAKVELSKIKRGTLNDSDWATLQASASFLQNAPIFIDDSAELTVLNLRAKCRRLKAEHGLRFVIVDYLQLMRSSRNDSRELEISDISRNLKVLAKELDIPVLALSQLNRKVEERSDKRPMLSDLRESGAIEQDADIIMFIHREDVYIKDKSKPKTNIAEVIIGKHRNGPVGNAELAYKSEYTSFENLARENSFDNPFGGTVNEVPFIKVED